MTAEQTAGIGRAARWVLLFCTLFGLATMHTLGHAGMHPDEHTHPVTMPATAVAMADAAQLTPAAVTDTTCTGHDCGHDRQHGTMSWWSICLAILGGLAAVVLLAALLQGPVRRRAGTGGGAAGRIRTPRPPPRRPARLTVVLRI
ncbi:MAG TPA: DUF6153 family protein [Actinoplanes sp.]